MTQSLVSIGHLCERFNQPYFAMMQRLVDLKVEPVLVLDLIPYFDFHTAYRALEGTPCSMILGAEHE